MFTWIYTNKQMVYVGLFTWICTNEQMVYEVCLHGYTNKQIVCKVYFHGYTRINKWFMRFVYMDLNKWFTFVYIDIHE